MRYQLSIPVGLEEDYNGQDTFKTPRGIRGYELLGGGDFDLWRVQGNLGGEDFPDTVRGPLNEGGLSVERDGAYGYPIDPCTRLLLLHFRRTSSWILDRFLEPLRLVHAVHGHHRSWDPRVSHDVHPRLAGRRRRPRRIELHADADEQLPQHRVHQRVAVWQI